MGPTIHLIARNEILLEGLRAVTADSGIDVSAATTVIGDIDSCSVPKDQLPDVVVVDAEMIGGNPFATIGELRRCHATSRLEVFGRSEVSTRRCLASHPLASRK